MGAFIARQPNGLLCRFSSVVDCVTHYNFTDEEYLNNCTKSTISREDAQDTLDNHLRPFSEVVDRMAPRNTTEEEIKEYYKEVGWTKWLELQKKILIRY